MSKLYVGLAFADSMVPTNCSCFRWELVVEQVKKILGDSQVLYVPPLGEEKLQIVNCCNPSHKATLDALQQKFGIDLMVGIADRPPTVKAEVGDFILVLSVRGLPRLTDRHEYTAEEVALATFSFGLWEVCTSKCRLSI